MHFKITLSLVYFSVKNPPKKNETKEKIQENNPKKKGKEAVKRDPSPPKKSDKLNPIKDLKKPKKKADLDLENPVKKTLNKKPVVGGGASKSTNDPKSKKPPQKSKKNNKTELDLDNPAGVKDKDNPKSKVGRDKNNDRALSPEALQDAEMAEMFGDNNENNDEMNQEDLDQFQDPNESGIGTQESTIIPDNENHSDEPVIPEVDEEESGDDLDQTDDNIANNLLTNVKEIRKGKFWENKCLMRKKRYTQIIRQLPAVPILLYNYIMQDHSSDFLGYF